MALLNVVRTSPRGRLPPAAALAAQVSNGERVLVMLGLRLQFVERGQRHDAFDERSAVTDERIPTNSGAPFLGEEASARSPGTNPHGTIIRAADNTTSGSCW